MEKGSAGFDRKFAVWIIKYRVLLIIGVMLTSIIFAARFAGLNIVTNLDDFIPQGHPYARVHNMMEDLFEGGDMVQISIEVKKGDIVNVDTMQKVFRITQDIYLMDGIIPPRLVSIFDIKTKRTMGNPDGFDTIRLAKAVPTNREELAALRENIRSDEILYGRQVSKDWKAVLIRAEFRDVDYGDLFRQFKELVEKEQDGNTDIHLSGRPIMLGWIDYYQMQLLPVFLLALAIMALLLYSAFRSIRGVVLPLLSALISVTWGMGILGILGFQLDPMASIVPFIILGIGVSHSVQVIQRYFEECRKGMDSKAAAEEVATVLFKPLFTSITTDGFAFLTMIAVKINLLKVLAICGSLSILSILFNIHILLPALLSFLPTPSKEKAERAGRSEWLSRLLTRIGKMSTTKRGAWSLVAGFLILVSFGMWGTAKMQIGGRAPGAGAFYDDAPYAVQTRAIGQKFPGAITYYIVFEGEEADSVKDPRLLKDIEGLQLYLNHHPKVGGSLSMVDFMKRMNAVTHDGDERQYRLPEVGELKLGYCENEKHVEDLVAAYFYLLSQGVPEEYNFIMTYDYTATNLQVFLKDMEADTIREILQVSKDYVRDNWTSGSVSVHIAGGLAGVVGAINEELQAGMVENMIQISLIVFLFCVVLLRSFVGALIVLISLFTRVIVVYGVMGLVPIPLTLYTMPVASLGIGIGVDYVIYVLVRIQEENERLGNIQQATVNALNTTGKAVFYTAMSVVLGVLVFVFSPLKFQFELGSMIGLIIFLNGLGAIALISPIVFLLKPAFIFKNKKEPGLQEASAAKEN